MAPARAWPRPLLVLLALVLPALFAGCLKGPTAGHGEYVMVVQNATESTAQVVVSVYHSATSLLPSERDEVIEGNLRVAPGEAGTFLFSLPDDTRSVVLQVHSYKRVMAPDEVASCPVLVFEVRARDAGFLGCGPRAFDAPTTSE